MTFSAKMYPICLPGSINYINTKLNVKRFSDLNTSFRKVMHETDRHFAFIILPWIQSEFSDGWKTLVN